MERLGGIHGPRDSETQSGESERDQYDGQHHQQKANQSEMDPDQGSEGEEDQSLKRGERSPAQHFAQHNRGTRHRRHQHRQQETFFAIFDDRHHGEDRSEQHDHDQRAGIEVIQIVLLSGGISGSKRTAEAGADDYPEQQRRSDHAHHAGALAIEADQFPPPQGERRKHDSGGGRGVRRKGCRLGDHVSSISAPGALS